MKIVEINWQPTDRQLRQFGLISVIALPILGWMWGANTTGLLVLAVVGLLLGAAGLTLPRLLKPVFIGMTLVAAPIGIVVGELAMLFIYFAVFLPFGLLSRLVRRDPLQLRVDRGQRSYWEPRKPTTNAASYFRQS